MLGSDEGTNEGTIVGSNEDEGCCDVEGMNEGTGDEEGTIEGGSLPVDGSCDGISDTDGIGDGGSVLSSYVLQEPEISEQIFSSPAHAASALHSCVGL